MNWIKSIFINYIMGRLNEQSTWQGIVLMLAAWAASHGVIVTDVQQAATLSWLLGGVGLLNAFLPNTFKKA